MCPDFHCNLTVRFTFNSCSKYVQLNNCKADLQFFYCYFYIGLYKAIKCKPCSEITVESGTQLKTVHICSVHLEHKGPINSDAVSCTFFLRLNAIQQAFLWIKVWLQPELIFEYFCLVCCWNTNFVFLSCSHSIFRHNYEAILKKSKIWKNQKKRNFLFHEVSNNLWEYYSPMHQIFSYFIWPQFWSWVLAVKKNLLFRMLLIHCTV